MKGFIPILAVSILLWAPLGAAADDRAPAAKVLIVDETEGLATSLRLEAMARVLVQRGFAVTAVLGFPRAPVEGGPFDLVLVIPKGGRYIWLCVPPRSEVIGEAMEEMTGLKELVAAVFGGTRELRTPADDLWPILLSLRLAALGIFGDG